jgi:hypothetical protein
VADDARLQETVNTAHGELQAGAGWVGEGRSGTWV